MSLFLFLKKKPIKNKLIRIENDKKIITYLVKSNYNIKIDILVLTNRIFLKLLPLQSIFNYLLKLFYNKVSRLYTTN